MKKQKKAKINPNSKLMPLHPINPLVAGVDIGSRTHFIAIPSHLDEKNVREIGCFTRDLEEAARWLQEKGIRSVAMESTGVYWIPFYDILDEAGIEVLLVNARHVKNVPGRKSDVLDCQWIQQLHSYGLLRGAFRPEGDICTLRGLMRQRETIVQEAASFKLRMQKALTQMNLQLHNVMSEITGEVGLKIMRDIVKGIRDSKLLAQYRTDRYKCSQDEFEKSLEGNYRLEHILSLKQAIEFYDFCQEKLEECDQAIQQTLERLHPASQEVKQPEKGSRKRRKNELYFDPREELKNLVGVDLTEIDGLDAHSVLKILAETGIDMDKWSSVKHFTSWLGLAPGTKISGGKKLSTRTKKCKNRAAGVFRVAAQTLSRSKSALGAFLRRKKAQLGAPEAITATAHKIAKIFYSMIKEKRSYQDLGADYYEQKYQNRVLKKVVAKAKSLGYQLIKLPEEENTESELFSTC